MTTFDLSSTTLWQPQSGHDGLVPIEHARHPVMLADSHGYNRVYSHRTFRLPMRVHYAFSWLESRPGPEYLGIVPSFVQDEENGYYATIRANGHLGATQEAVNYDGFKGSSHNLRPGRTRKDGQGRVFPVRDHVTIDWHPDRIVIEINGQEALDAPAGDNRSFPPMRVGRLGLRLDKQQVLFASIVAEEL